MQYINLIKQKYFKYILLFFIPAMALGKPNIIPEVNLHSNLFSSNIKDVQGQTTRITRKEIKHSPVMNLSEFLKQEQSIVRVINNSMDSGQMALSIRGFGDNAAANSLILVDGFPLTNVSLLTPNFNAIALTDIERIDIIQGSQGSLWGDQAVGGVVNIITQHPEKFIADVYAGMGSFNGHFYNVLVGSKFSQGLFFKLLGFSNNTDNYRHHNRQNNEALSAQAGVDYARGIISVALQLSENTVLFPGGLSQAQFDANQRQAVNFKNFSHFRTNNVELLNKHELNPNWILETRLSHNELAGDGMIGNAFERNEWQNNFNPKLIGKLGNNRLLLGYFGQNNYYHFLNSSIEERANSQQNNIYLQTTIPISNNIDLTLGARSAWQNNSAERMMGHPIHSTHHIFVSEQGISYHPSSEWQFFMRRDGNFRFPKANEETWTPFPEIGLQPQTGVSYEMGMIYSTELQKTQLNIYQLQLNHEIAFDPSETPSEPFGTYSNFAPTRRRGVTLTEFYQLTPKITLNSQLNYVQARLASGSEIPTVPAFNANAGVSDDFAENWRAKYSTLYTGSRYASLDLNNDGKKQPGYRIDTLALQYIQKSYQLSFEVANVFDSKYAMYTIYNAPGQSYLYYPGMGRSYLLTLKTSID